MSTYSNLKIELIGTGEQDGTWGTTTNVNLGTALEEAIVGTVDQAVTASNLTLALTDSNATQVARHLRLNLTGSAGGASNLTVPTLSGGKNYYIKNSSNTAITVKTASGSGILVPAGKSASLYQDGTNVVEAADFSTSYTISTLTATDLTVTNDAVINGLTVGKGANAVATNTVLGVDALDAAVTGGNNVAIGKTALGANTSGNRNIAVGEEAMGTGVNTGQKNIAIGYQAGKPITSGVRNVVIGDEAGIAMTTGGTNTIVGTEAGKAIVTTGDNTIVGNEAGKLNTTTLTAFGAFAGHDHVDGYSNTFIGRYAGREVTNGHSSTAVGNAALLTATTAVTNTAIGCNSMRLTTTGADNTAVGFESLDNNTTGYSNTALGGNALLHNTTGYSNTAIGRLSMGGGNPVTGNANTSLGRSSLAAITSGTQNVAVGFNALDANTTTSNNTAVGSNALGATTGTGNTGLGESAGSATLTGSNNTMLGSGAQPSASSVSNEITLGNGSATKVRMGNGDPIYDTGSILQIVTNTPDTGIVNRTNTAWANLDGDLHTSITPKNASSTLILEAVFVFGGNNNTGVSFQKFVDITTSTDVNLGTAGSRQGCHSCVRNQDYDANDCVMVTMMTTIGAASTNARTYTIYNRCENGTQQSFFGNPSNASALGYAKPTFKITEVLG